MVAGAQAPERAKVRTDVAVRRGDANAPRGDHEVATGGAVIGEKSEVVRRMAGCREDYCSRDLVAVSERLVWVKACSRAEAVFVASGGTHGCVRLRRDPG